MIVVLFWLLTFILIICALGFFLPWLRSWRAPKSFLVSIIFGLVCYTLYFTYGSSQYLGSYYAPEEQELRKKQTAFRPLLVAFKKQEFRFRLRLDENPKDVEAKWRLLDLLAVKALLNGERALALEYWQKAIVLVSNASSENENRARIKEMIEILKKP